jgi:hypothetical protein
LVGWTPTSRATWQKGEDDDEDDDEDDEAYGEDDAAAGSSDDVKRLVESITWYLDGSGGIHTKEPRLRRAGWAAESKLLNLKSRTAVSTSRWKSGIVDRQNRVPAAFVLGLNSLEGLLQQQRFHAAKSTAGDFDFLNSGGLICVCDSQDLSQQSPCQRFFMHTDVSRKTGHQ